MRKTVLALMLTVACSKYSQQEEQTKAPTVGLVPPSPQTLALELAAMTQGAARAGVGSGLHQAQASLFVALVEAHVAKHLRVPIALLEAASGAQPQLVDRGEHVWSFQVDVDGRLYTANLRSVAAGDVTAWSLGVTSRPFDGGSCCEDFMLMSGEASGSGQISWQLYDPSRAEAPSRLLSVTYATSAPGQRKLTVQVNSLRPRAERFGAGSLVVQEILGDQVQLIVRDSAEAGARSFEWSNATSAGSYQDADGRKFCWSGELEGFRDLACPVDESGESSL